MCKEKINLGNYETAVVEELSEEDRIKYAYLLMGYHESICSLNTLLDYKSEPVQKLVELVYGLMYEIEELYVNRKTDFSPERFAEQHIAFLLLQKCYILDVHKTDGYEFLVNSIKYFGEIHS